MKISFRGDEFDLRIPIIVGRDLRLMRLKANITLVVAAEYMGIKSRKTIESWEANRSQPTIQQLLQLCLFYGFYSHRIITECLERAKSCNPLEDYQSINLDACLIPDRKNTGVVNRHEPQRSTSMIDF